MTRIVTSSAGDNDTVGSSEERDTLLLACAHHTAGHQKFGDPLEAYRRFTEALG